MRITERQLRRIIREAMGDEERQIVGPDYGDGVVPLSVGAKILALQQAFLRDIWDRGAGRGPWDSAQKETKAKIEAFRKYAASPSQSGGGRVATWHPALENALEAFIKSWASDPVWRPTNAVDAADEAYEAHAPVNAAKDNSRAKDAAESAPHAARHREMVGAPAHIFKEPAHGAARGVPVSESKRRISSRKLW